MLIAGVSPSPIGGDWGNSVPVASRVYVDSRGSSGYECDCHANPRNKPGHPATWRVKSWQARVVLGADGQPVAVEIRNQHVRHVCANRLLQVNTDRRWNGQVVGMWPGAYGEAWPPDKSLPVAP